MLRVGLVVSFIGLLIFSQATIGSLDKDRWSALEDTYISINHRVSYRPIYREWAKLGFTWIDNGTMLTTWIMRPLTDNNFNYSCYPRPWNYREPSVCDNRNYVLTDLLTAFAAYATYILAIAATLQLAHYLHWRRERHANPVSPSPAT